MTHLHESFDVLSGVIVGLYCTFAFDSIVGEQVKPMPYTLRVQIWWCVHIRT